MRELAISKTRSTEHTGHVVKHGLDSLVKHGLDRLVKHGPD
jgi:hypothetical protein